MSRPMPSGTIRLRRFSPAASPERRASSSPPASSRIVFEDRPDLRAHLLPLHAGRVCGHADGEDGNERRDQRVVAKAATLVVHLFYSGAGAGSILPNRPWLSPSGPAVKYSVLDDPEFALPWPNCNAHSPSIFRGGPLAEWSWPSCTAWPVPRALARSNALILPSPKLPTSSAPPNAPNVGGASARPQGELRRAFEATRRIRFPTVSYWST